MKVFFTAMLILILIICIPSAATAEELVPPPVPSDAQDWMPVQAQSFENGIISVLRQLIHRLRTAVMENIGHGAEIIACVMLVSILRHHRDDSSTVILAGVVCISSVMLRSSAAMISLASDTVQQISEYTKLFLPVITAAASTQGAVSSSAMLCVGTSFCSAVVNRLILRLLLPAVFLFFAVSIVNSVIAEPMLKQIKSQMLKFCIWAQKMVLALFLSYITVSGAITGTADKAAIKTARAAISAVVPVIGNTLADASEALLLSSGIIKNSIGLFGVFAFLALFFAPFVKIGAYYLVLKLSSIFCALLDTKPLSDLIGDFCSGMGLLLGMIGTMCVISLISTVCFMRGIIP